MRAAAGRRFTLQDFPCRCSQILTVPFKRPIKPVYIRKLVAFIDEVKINDGSA